MAILRNSNILVTGADGFIGSHLAEALLQRGCNVRALALYNATGSWGHLNRFKNISHQRLEVVLGDVRDAALMLKIMDGCSVVFHLAALIGIPYSYVAPQSYTDTNISGTLNLLLAARERSLVRFIHTSTSEVYGTAKYTPINEQHPIEAQSPYAATKIAADHMVLAFHRSFDLPTVVVRPFNTYGPRQSARAIVPTIITQIAAGKRTVHLGSIHPTRDLSFVKDTVAGFLAIAEADAAVGEVINLGTGCEISICELAHLIAEIMEVDIGIQTADERIRPPASEVERLIADVTKARRIAGWAPQFAGRSGIRQGLTETIAWFRDPANLMAYDPTRYQI